MVEDEDWVTKRSGEARKGYPSVTDSTVTKIIELLKGKAMDQQLSAAELHQIAKTLLADLPLPAAAKTGVTDAH